MTESPLGSIIAGRYRVDSLIGSGGMADVYRGVDTTLDRPVAVKVLTDRSGDIRQRFLREAQSMARLNHPNIVSVYDAGESTGVSYIIMELAEGRTLRALSDEGVSTEHAISLCIELCEALQYAHAQGVIHRDIKPSNLMVLETGVVKVMDFGLARRTTDVSMTAQAGEIVGTISYLPPERFLGRAGDVAGDLYSLGVVMYELFCHRLPFESVDDDLVAVIFAHINQPATPPHAVNSEIPEALDALILRMLAKDPSQRPQSAADVAAELRAILTGGEAPARPAPVEAAPPFRAPQAPPAPRAATAANAVKGPEESTHNVRSLLDATLRSSRTLNQALADVMGGMLAARNRRYEEAEASYTSALATLEQLGGQETEWAKTALKFGLMVLQKATEGRATQPEIKKAEELLERAIPIFHARQQRSELTDAERILQAFRRISTRLM
ncbi:MAG TPA: protein kinase [Candidatus Dormibacteraeota bacterium]|nr:protein kinase [Candidatus Dormibacteraeota bacterium]